jgi:asparagine synthase (glutamine-hydrolysing)
MAGWLPEAIISKRKQGFAMPYNEWIYTDDRIRPLAVDALAGMRGRGYLSDTFLDRLHPEAADPSSRNPDLLWNIVVLELWLRAYRAPTSMTAAA